MAVLENNWSVSVEMWCGSCKSSPDLNLRCRLCQTCQSGPRKAVWVIW